MAGLGRTGTVASMLLIERGIDVEESISMVRKARPGTIQTFEQEEFLRKYSKRLDDSRN